MHVASVVNHCSQNTAAMFGGREEDVVEVAFFHINSVCGKDYFFLPTQPHPSVIWWHHALRVARHSTTPHSLYSTGSQTLSRDPFVGRGHTFKGPWIYISFIVIISKYMASFSHRWFKSNAPEMLIVR